MSNTKIDTFDVSLPGDMFDNMEEFLNYAIYDARENAEDYVMPANWTAERVSGNIGDNEIVFRVSRESRKPKQQSLIAFAEYYGDPSVGIPHQSFKIELHDVDMSYVEQDGDWRRHLREALQRAAWSAYGEDGLGGIRFADECPDCDRVGCKGECCEPPEEDIDSHVQDHHCSICGGQLSLGYCFNCDAP